MALSPEAIIALIALLIACFPVIRFAIQSRKLLRQWWNQDNSTGGPPVPFSAHNQPDEENHDNNQLNHTPGSQLINHSYLPLPSTSGQSTQQLESGLFIFVRNEALAGVFTDGASASQEELHELV
ncbi:hypothetical protein BDW75DRAFT_235408 [Aspergillus navahoensis]